jgi:hypothetical protein
LKSEVMLAMVWRICFLLGVDLSDPGYREVMRFGLGRVNCVGVVLWVVI